MLPAPAPPRMASSHPVPTASALVINKYVGAIHIIGDLSLLQWKAANVLHFNAYSELDKPEIFSHSIRLAELAAHVGYNSNDYDSLKDVVVKLNDTRVEWNLLEDDGKERWGTASYLSQAEVERGSGVLTYTYPPKIRTFLHNPRVFASINLEVQKRFTSSPALRLYENCLRFHKVGSTGWLPIETWRGLLGVADDAYPEYKELQRRVLGPALKQVNELSDIEVEVERRREGRRVSALRYRVRRTPGSTAIPLVAVDPGDSGPSDLLSELRQVGLTPDQVEEVSALAPDVVRRNLQWVRDFVRSGGEVRRTLPALALAAIRSDYARSSSVGGRAMQTSLFAPPEPPPPSLAVEAAAARERERRALDGALDARLARLGPAQRGLLDGMAIQRLRDERHPELDEIERAVAGGDESALGVRLASALLSARREVVATWRDGDGPTHDDPTQR